MPNSSKYCNVEVISTLVVCSLRNRGKQQKHYTTSECQELYFVFIFFCVSFSLYRGIYPHMRYVNIKPIIRRGGIVRRGYCDVRIPLGGVHICTSLTGDFLVKIEVVLLLFKIKKTRIKHTRTRDFTWRAEVE